jgi:Leucine-rich repeat (LRR) protein
MLSKLQNLSLNGNNFTKSIPPSLSNISSLQLLNLGCNKLSGSIRSSIFNISTLLEIYLKFCMTTQADRAAGWKTVTVTRSFMHASSYIAYIPYTLYIVNQIIISKKKLIGTSLHGGDKFNYIVYSRIDT